MTLLQLLRRAYQCVVPLNIRLALRAWRIRIVGRLPNAADTPPDSAQPSIQDPGLQAALLVQSLVQTGRHRDYANLWLEHGFSVIPDYPTLPSHFSAVKFDDSLVLPPLESTFLPNFFILGAAKSGTTTLHLYFKDSPLICMSNPKEPFFFEAEFSLGLGYYQRRYFAHWRGESVIGEARHRNLYLPYMPSRIVEINPQAKFLVIVRNPVERAYSHWWHWRSLDVEQLPFRDAIEADYARIQRGYRLETPQEAARYCGTLDSSGKGIYRTYVDSGYYFEQIERYCRLFSPEQVKVVLLDDLRTMPYQTIHEIELFLGVPYYQEVGFQVRHSNEFFPPRELIGDQTRGSMDADTAAWLIEHYKPHNTRLQAFLQRDLTHWDVRPDAR